LENIHTDEGSWLREDCNERLVTDGFTWGNNISLAYLSTEVEPAPRVPRNFNWNPTLLLTKLQEVRQTTKLQVLKQYNYTDKWFAVFGVLKLASRYKWHWTMAASGSLRIWTPECSTGATDR